VFGCTADGIYNTTAVFPACEPEINSESFLITVDNRNGLTRESLLKWKAHYS
jgi:hypothetical protein